MARGVGLNPDSAFYLDGAVNLSSGNGYYRSLYWYFRPISAEEYIREIVSEGRVKLQPETYFPPFYSISLAFLIKVGLGAETAAAWMASVLFSLNALIVGFLVFRFTRSPARVAGAHSGREMRDSGSILDTLRPSGPGVEGLSRGSWPLAFAAALFMLASECMLNVHTNALPEPLFILLCLAGMAIQSEYAEKGGWGLLLAGALVSGLAFLTRYLGAALIGTGLLGVCAGPKRPVWKKVPAALVFLFLSCLPMAGFFLRNFLLTGRSPLASPVLPRWGDILSPEVRSTFASWALPGSYRVELFPGQNTVLSSAVAVVLAAVIIGTFLLARRERKAGLSHGSRPRIPHLFALFVPIYLVVFFFGDVFGKGLLKLGSRLLSPLFAPLLIVTAHLLWRWLGPRPWGGIRRASSAILIVYGLCYAGCGVYWMAVCHREGRGYNSRVYQAPEVAQVMEEVRALGPVPIFTNDCGAVYFQAGRYGYQYVPDRGTRDIATLARAVGSAPACFVYYWTPVHRAGKQGRLDRDRLEKSLIETFAPRILARTEMLTVLWRPGLP